jgi:hypothetical protein
MWVARGPWTRLYNSTGGHRPGASLKGGTSRVTLVQSVTKAPFKRVAIDAAEASPQSSDDSSTPTD